MDLRHVHLIPRLTGKGSSVSQTFPQVNQHHNSKEEINLKISSCYATPAVIRKLKHSTLFHIRKQLAECLILSKIDYNDIVSHPIPLAAAAFVLGRYAHMPDVIKLGWIPIKERKENHILLNTFKALHYNDWPSYLS